MFIFKCVLSLIIQVFAANIALYSQIPERRWQMNPDGSIVWHINDRLPHIDHIEMTGEQISAIIKYGVDAGGAFEYTRTLIWPMLKKKGDGVRDHLKRYFDWDILKTIHVNGEQLLKDTVSAITLNGFLTVKSKYRAGLECTRTFFPSNTRPVYIEKYELKNVSKKILFTEVPAYKISSETDGNAGYYGQYVYIASSAGAGAFRLEPGQSLSFGIIFSGFKKAEAPGVVDLETEESGRKQRIDFWWNNLVLETPQQELDLAFAFAKIRASESIFRTKGGLLHSPGGGDYYAAIWANDQGEYVGPFFPFLGYNIGNEASLNAYDHYARFMNPGFKPLPCSIISEGDTIWNSVGDRGDAAMIAYGASRYALALGDKKIAEHLWPLIAWCLEYCNRQKNADGVISSNTDELEGRFPTGTANLSTSSLYYDALVSAGYLARDLSKDNKEIARYTKNAQEIKDAIGRYFGGTIEGFDTYRYYKGNDVLRSWICLPLVVNILDRKQGTVDALFSPRLWTADGLATEAGQTTFWDRSTLYALRGVFAAGEKDKALKFLTYYSKRRLLEEHVPYPVEAYPEGNQRHLSAESGLYCRIFTEGLFGIRPAGLHAFNITPRLPDTWTKMALRKIHAFGKIFDIEINRENGTLRMMILSEGKPFLNQIFKEGEPVLIRF